MGSITKRGSRYQAQVSLDGSRKSRSFRTKAEARAWIDDVEINGFNSNLTVGRLMDKYLDEISVHKKGFQWEKVRIEKFKRLELANTRLDRINSKHVSDWKHARLQEVSASSVNREWNLLSAIFSQGVEWKLINKNPMKEVKRPAPGKARNRIYTADEIDRILYTLGDSIVKDLFLFALETAIRTKEMCLLQWVNVHERYVHLPGEITKNSHSRDVPLSSKARDILKLLKNATYVCSENSELTYVFGGIKPSSVDPIFRRARDKAMVEGVTFHDTRATALTRLAKIYDPMTLAKISGHRDLRILLNTYYRPDIEDIASKLD